MGEQTYSDRERQALAAVSGAPNRRAVLGDVVQHGPARNMDIAERTGLKKQRVSEALGTLTDVGATEVVTPEGTHIGRLYDATAVGETVHGVVGDE